MEDQEVYAMLTFFKYELDQISKMARGRTRDTRARLLRAYIQQEIEGLTSSGAFFFDHVTVGKAPSRKQTHLSTEGNEERSPSVVQ
jgi:hypothetical protein